MEELVKRNGRLKAMRVEAAHAEVSNFVDISTVPCYLTTPLIETSATHPVHEDLCATARVDFYTDPMSASSGNKRRRKACNEIPQDRFTPPTPSNSGSSIGQLSSSLLGVSNCFVFKSQLQEYAQKVGLPTPVYETTKEGPSHEPSFRSTVIVNDVRYDSLTGFFNRKAAEQSAAEVALMQLAKSGKLKESISQPVHETGLCKNLLQEYAQKMNYAIPTYDCQKDETPGRMPLFSCTVEIGGIRYIGATARTKKEAEIKAARTALLAIRWSANELDGKPMVNSQLTVIPCKKKGTESGITSEQTAKALKPKKGRFKKKLRKKLHENKVGHTLVENAGTLEVNNMDGQSGLEVDHTKASAVQVADPGRLAMEAAPNFQDGISNFNQNGGEKSVVEGVLVLHLDNNSQNGRQPASNFNHEIPDTSICSMFHVASMVNNSTMVQREASSVMAGMNQMGDGSYMGSNQG